MRALAHLSPRTVFQISWSQFVENYAAAENDTAFSRLLQEKLQFSIFSGIDLAQVLLTYGCGSVGVPGSGGAICYSCSQ